MTLYVVVLLIGGFLLGYLLARYYSWYFMWLFYTVGNITMFFAMYTYAGTGKIPTVSLYFAFFAAGMFIGLFVGDKSGKKPGV